MARGLADSDGNEKSDNSPAEQIKLANWLTFYLTGWLPVGLADSASPQVPMASSGHFLARKLRIDRLQLAPPLKPPQVSHPLRPDCRKFRVLLVHLVAQLDAYLDTSSEAWPSPSLVRYVR